MSDGAPAVLPPLYRAWLEELLGPVAGEPRATCSKCAMADWPDEPPKEHTFLANAKCCTYQPDLPNFLVGRIVHDDAPLGEASRRVLRERIEHRVGVTPLGITAAPVYMALYEASAASTSTAFGRSLVLRCPHYVDRDGGLCGIWQHREAVCTTWFCKFDRGVMGRVYWRVLLALIRAIEGSLKFWAAAKAGLAEECLAELWGADESKGGGRTALDDNALNNVMDPALYRRYWGKFVGREAELYNLTSAYVSPLGWKEVRAIGGALVAGAANAATVISRRLKNEPLPPRVTAGGSTIYQISSKPGQLRARSPLVHFDWLEVPESVVRELGRFENADVRKVIADLQAEGVSVDGELVRALLDWQVLVAA